MIRNLFREQKALQASEQAVLPWYANLNNLQGVDLCRLEVGGVGQCIYQKSFGKCEFDIAYQRH